MRLIFKLAAVPTVVPGATVAVASPAGHGGAMCRKMRIRRLSWLIAIAVAFALTSTVPAEPAHAAGGQLNQERGFDACTTPSTSTMATWWTNSPYYVYFPYIGGSNKANCGGATISASWVSTVVAQGWNLVFIWVGPQMPYGTCQTHDPYNNYMSLNTTTAYQQGQNEAVSAYNQLLNLQVTTAQAPVVYDLEYYNNVASCRAAAKSFMKGWADQMALPPAQKSGLYGSACISYVSDMASNGHPPDFIWPGDSNTGMYTSTISCIPNGYWSSQQRHKQYLGGHSETWGGAQVNMDTDCSNGPTYGNASNLDGRCV